MGKFVNGLSAETDVKTNGEGVSVFSTSEKPDIPYSSLVNKKPTNLNFIVEK